MTFWNNMVRKMYKLYVTNHFKYILHIFRRGKLLLIKKYAYLSVGNIPFLFSIVKQFIPCEKLTFNVGYYFQIYRSQVTGDKYI